MSSDSVESCLSSSSMGFSPEKINNLLKNPSEYEKFQKSNPEITKAALCYFFNQNLQKFHAEIIHQLPVLIENLQRKIQKIGKQKKENKEVFELAKKSYDRTVDALEKNFFYQHKQFIEETSKHFGSCETMDQFMTSFQPISSIFQANDEKWLALLSAKTVPFLKRFAYCELWNLFNSEDSKNRRASLLTLWNFGRLVVGVDEMPQNVKEIASTMIAKFIPNIKQSFSGEPLGLSEISAQMAQVFKDVVFNTKGKNNTKWLKEASETITLGTFKSIFSFVPKEFSELLMKRKIAKEFRHLSEEELNQIPLNKIYNLSKKKKKVPPEGGKTNGKEKEPSVDGRESESESESSDSSSDENESDDDIARDSDSPAETEIEQVLRKSITTFIESSSKKVNLPEGKISKPEKESEDKTLPLDKDKKNASQTESVFPPSNVTALTSDLQKEIWELHQKTYSQLKTKKKSKTQGAVEKEKEKEEETKTKIETLDEVEVVTEPISVKAEKEQPNIPQIENAQKGGKKKQKSAQLKPITKMSEQDKERELERLKKATLEASAREEKERKKEHQRKKRLKKKEKKQKLQRSEQEEKEIVDLLNEKKQSLTLEEQKKIPKIRKTLGQVLFELKTPVEDQVSEILRLAKLLAQEEKVKNQKENPQISGSLLPDSPLSSASNPIQANSSVSPPDLLPSSHTISSSEVQGGKKSRKSRKKTKLGEKKKTGE